MSGETAFEKSLLAFLKSGSWESKFVKSDDSIDCVYQSRGTVAGEAAGIEFVLDDTSTSIALNLEFKIVSKKCDIAEMRKAINFMNSSFVSGRFILSEANESVTWRGVILVEGLEEDKKVVTALCKNLWAAAILECDSFRYLKALVEVGKGKKAAQTLLKLDIARDWQVAEL